MYAMKKTKMSKPVKKAVKKVVKKAVKGRKKR